MKLAAGQLELIDAAKAARENASYPLSVCAERNAVAAAAVAGAQPGDVRAVAIVAHASSPAPPCGACRQVLSEFADPDVVVVIHNLADGSTTAFTVGELLPQAFGPDNLASS